MYQLRPRHLAQLRGPLGCAVENRAWGSGQGLSGGHVDPEATACTELLDGGISVVRVWGQRGVGRDGDKDAQPWRSVSTSAIEPGPVPPQHVTAPSPTELATSRASGKKLTCPEAQLGCIGAMWRYSLLLSLPQGLCTCPTLLHHHLARSAPEASWERQRRAPEGPKAIRVWPAPAQCDSQPHTLRLREALQCSGPFTPAAPDFSWQSRGKQAR